ncbi:hypothetical protein PR048_029165 [Dryococelus australis]|uniref:DDE Tnp4 domain-containing protein n=1 Tax=Dryococelus australis TaxID=614101 RepID=A0ABQ9GCY5_9NEOP|nr:hypothetical protein PR048_029165 [Dryococelus australis]
MEVSEISHLSRKLEDGSLHFPKEGTIAGKNMRYVLVVDDSFPLMEYVMKPFSRKVATRARKIFSYLVFGIIVERFVHHIVTTCCALHNFLRSKVPHQYTPLECLGKEFESGDVATGPRCNEPMSLSKTACQPTNSAELVRESFVEYFNNGQVSLATKVYWVEAFLYSYSLPIFTRVYSKLSDSTQRDRPVGKSTHVSSAYELAGRPAELREFPQANSPDDFPSDRHTRSSFVFQDRTVQADRKAELTVRV